MANTLSVMTNVLRNVVSKKRIRYKENGFNLDLAYICDNIIAMGYPADNIESIYRNRIDDVYKFLEENHRDHYKIYNLCLERSYDINKFHGRVAVYPFEDHNPPTIELILKFCDDVDTWLKADSLNVAAVHCKAGKGRTGTMICCYLLYSKQQSSAEDALSCYDEKRTRDRKGVTIPSQRRYVQYFSKLIRSGLPYEKRTLQFSEIRFIDDSLLHSQGLVYCFISVLQDTACAVKVQQLRSFTIDFRQTFSLDIQNPSLLVAGDIKVELTHKTPKKKIFHFWFNTYFVSDSAVVENEGGRTKLVYTLSKNEIDDAHKDKEHKCFSEDFKVQLVFSMEEPGGKRPTSVSNQIGNHKTSQTARLTQNNFAALPQNSRSSSELNYICDQKSSSIASVNSLDLLGGVDASMLNFNNSMDQANNYMSSSNNSSSNNVQKSASGYMNTTQSHNSMEDEEMGTPLSPPPSYAHFNGVDANHHQTYVNMNSSYLSQQQQMQQQQQHELYAKVVKPIVNATSTPNQKMTQKSAPAQQLNSQQPMQFMHQQQHYQPSASNIPRVNNNRDSKDTNSKHQTQLSQQQQQQHHEQQYELKSTTPDKSKSFGTCLGIRCAPATPFGPPAETSNCNSNSNANSHSQSQLQSHTYATSPPAASSNRANIITNSKGKSNSVSSSSDSTSTTSSASSSPSSNASGDNEEGWESGESSSKPNSLLLSPLTTPTSSTTYINNTTSIPASKLHKNFFFDLYSNCNNSSSFRSKSGGDDHNNDDGSIVSNGDCPRNGPDDNIIDDRSQANRCGGDDRKLLSSNTKQKHMLKHKNHAEATAQLALASATDGDEQTHPSIQQLMEYPAQQALISKATVANRSTPQPLSHTFTSISRTTNSARNKFRDLLKSKAGRKQTLFRRKSFKKTADAAALTANSCSIESTKDVCGGSNCTSAKPKIKLRSKKFAQKFQIFQSYFRADPIDFCENFAQQTTSMRRNSNCSTTPSGRRVYSSSPPLYMMVGGSVSNSNTPLSCSPVLAATLSAANAVESRNRVVKEPTGVIDSGTILSGSNISIPAGEGDDRSASGSGASRSVSGRSVSVGGDDFYSSICDNQLSFNNSPCKSPRSMREKYRRPVSHAQLLPSESEFNEYDDQQSLQVTVQPTTNCSLVIAERPTKIAIGFDVLNSGDSGVANGHKSGHSQQLNLLAVNAKENESFREETIATGSSIYLTPLSNPIEETDLDAAAASVLVTNTASSSPFVFPKINDELQCLSASGSANGCKNRVGNATLNLLILKEPKNAAPPREKESEVSTPCLGKAPTNVFDNDSDIDIAPGTDGSGSGSGHSHQLGSAGFSNSGSSGFCTSECCPNSSNGSGCICNPFFVLDTEI